MQNEIQFSIIVPTYNRAHIISKTLDSILSQTYTNYELIIVDDGSTDNTEEFISNNYRKQVRYFKKKNEERSAARNFGTLHAKGKYVIWFDSDDIMYPDYLEVADKLIAINKSPEVIAFSHHYLDIKDEVVSTKILPSNVNSRLYIGNFLSCNAMIIRRDIALDNPFNVDLNAGEDYELWLRLASQFNILSSKEVTSGIVLHEERSEHSMEDKHKLITRFEKFLKYTTGNKHLMDFLGKKSSYFIMKNYLILAVDLAHNKHKKEARTYLKKAIKTNKSAFFTRTFFATLKQLIKI